MLGDEKGMILFILVQEKNSGKGNGVQHGNGGAVNDLFFVFVKGNFREGSLADHAALAIQGKTEHVLEIRAVFFAVLRNAGDILRPLFLLQSVTVRDLCFDAGNIRFLKTSGAISLLEISEYDVSP